MKKTEIVPLLKNKKATFLYSIIETYECGIVLYGFEVKSIKKKQFNFTDCYARISKHNSVLLYHMHISPYAFAPSETYDPIRIRTLLLHKQEIHKIKRKTNEKGLTLVPIEAYTKNGLIKIALGLAKGKKLFQKKESIKERTLKREAQQASADMMRGKK